MQSDKWSYYTKKFTILSTDSQSKQCGSWLIEAAKFETRSRHTDPSIVWPHPPHQRNCQVCRHLSTIQTSISWKSPQFIQLLEHTPLKRCSINHALLLLHVWPFWTSDVYAYVSYQAARFGKLLSIAMNYNDIFGSFWDRRFLSSKLVGVNQDRS